MRYIFKKTFVVLFISFSVFLFFPLVAPSASSRAIADVIVSQPDASAVPIGAPDQSGGQSACFATPYPSHAYAKSLTIAYESTGQSPTPPSVWAEIFISGFSDPSCSTFQGTNPSQLKYSQFNPYPGTADFIPVTNGAVNTLTFDLTHLGTCSDGCAGSNGYDLSKAPYHRITIGEPTTNGFTIGSGAYFHIMAAAGSAYTTSWCSPNWIEGHGVDLLCRQISGAGLAYSFDGTASSTVALNTTSSTSTTSDSDTTNETDQTTDTTTTTTTTTYTTTSGDTTNNSDSSSGSGGTDSQTQTSLDQNGTNGTDQTTDTTTTTNTTTSTPARTPVLIIPGVLGTEISDADGNKLWLDVAHTITDIGDQFMDPLAFGSDLKPVNTNLVLGNILRKEGTFLKYSAFDYSQALINELQDQGYIEGTSLFIFPYDWRYGVSEDVVSQLRQKIIDIMTQTGSNKVDVVAHSTGGLILKKYVMEHQADNHIGKAIFVGVPNTGAPKVIKVFLQGDSFSLPSLADSEMQKLAQNFPVVYDLAPSEQYYDAKGSYMTVFDQGLISSKKSILDFGQTNDLLTGEHGLSVPAISNSTALHTSDFDNYDLRTAGIDLYSIDGCKTGTIGGISETRFAPEIGFSPKYAVLKEVPGDGTVPLESSTNLPIDPIHKYYSLNADHGEMLSQEGIRQEIVSIISGTEIPVPNSLVTQNISKCQLNGMAISIYSPLSIDVVDQDGNHAGIAADGVSIENTVPNADYEILGDRKFVYLATDAGQIYTIKITGTDSGTFTLTDAKIADSAVVQTEVFDSIPVTTTLSGQIKTDNGTILALDTDGDGVVDKTLQPSFILNADDSANFNPVHLPDAAAVSSTTDEVVAVSTQIVFGNSAGEVSTTVPAANAPAITPSAQKLVSFQPVVQPKIKKTQASLSLQTPVVSKELASIQTPELLEPLTKNEVSSTALVEESQIPILPTQVFGGIMVLFGLIILGKMIIKE